MSEVRRSPRRSRLAFPGGDPELPTSKYQFVVTKKTYTSLDLYHAALLDAQKAGNKVYWSLVAVVKDIAKDGVFLECKFCHEDTVLVTHLGLHSCWVLGHRLHSMILMIATMKCLVEQLTILGMHSFIDTIFIFRHCIEFHADNANML